VGFALALWPAEPCSSQMPGANTTPDDRLVRPRRELLRSCPVRLNTRTLSRPRRGDAAITGVSHVYFYFGKTRAFRQPVDIDDVEFRTSAAKGELSTARDTGRRVLNRRRSIRREACRSATGRTRPAHPPRVQFAHCPRGGNFPAAKRSTGGSGMLSRSGPSLDQAVERDPLP